MTPHASLTLVSALLLTCLLVNLVNSKVESDAAQARLKATEMSLETARLQLAVTRDLVKLSDDLGCEDAPATAEEQK